MAGDRRPPPRGFEQARLRELARPNVRVSSIRGRECHTPDDEALLGGDSAARRTADMDTVRRWAANAPGRGGGAKTARSATPSVYPPQFGEG